MPVDSPPGKLLESLHSEYCTADWAFLLLLYRWQFNLKTGTVQEQTLDDHACEFPRINEQYLGRPTRYGYAGSTAPIEMPKFDGLYQF